VSSKDRVSSNLVALGVAAVLTVYGAGYQRTEAAARALDEDLDERRPPPAISPSAAPVAEGATANQSVPVASPVDSARADTAGRVARGAADSLKGAAIAIRRDSAAMPSKPVAVAAGSLPDSTRTGATAATDSSSQPVVRGRYKDGVYFGRGSSRHGDIHMGVEIKDGRIKSAFISECLTNYECDWIFHLPKQVVERQSAEVDFVSGATQSANALYRAVVNALNQAK
jgi:uncharacterized protein with FMN-binding domain